MANFSEESRDTTKTFLEILSELGDIQNSESPRGEGINEELSLQNLKDLRKVLAELQLDLRKLKRESGWNREKYLLCALFQAKLKRLESADLFVDMEDIQLLADIRSAAEEIISEGIRLNSIQQDPLSRMYGDAQLLHQIIQEMRVIYEDVIDVLTEVMGADWTKDQIKAQKQTNQSLWNTFLEKLNTAKDHLATTFSECKNGPETELFALFKILNPKDSLTRDDFEETLELTSRNGSLWDKIEGLFNKYQNRIEQLLQYYKEDEQHILEAHLQAQQGNFEKAEELMRQTTGSFADLPYSTVKEEVQRWKQLSLQPLQEMARLLPGLAVQESSQESYYTLARQFSQLAKEYLHKKFRGIYTPIGLFLTSKRLELRAKKFSKFCDDSLRDLEQNQSSDFQERIKANWETARENSNELRTVIQKQAFGYFVKKSLILVLIAICSYCGYQLYNFWQNLPETGIRFTSTGIPLVETTIKDKKNNILRSWNHSEQGSIELSSLPPEKYSIHLNFENSFPIQLPLEIALGELPDITPLIQEHYRELQNRHIEFNTPFGCEITLKHLASGLVRKYGIQAETLSVEMPNCTAIDWDTADKTMVIADRKGRVYVMRTGDSIEHTGTIFVQGESFDSIKLSRGSSHPMILAVSKNGTVYVWEKESGKLLEKLIHSQANVISAAFYNNQKSILTLDADFQLRSWELGRSKPVKSLSIEKENKEENDWELIHPHPAWMFNLPGGLKQSLTTKVQASKILTFQDSKLLTLAILNEDGQLRIWSGNDLESLKMRELPKQETTSFAIHPSGNWIVTSSPRGDLFKLVLHSEEDLHWEQLKLNGKFQDVTAMQFDPSGEKIIAANILGELFAFYPNQSGQTLKLTVQTPPIPIYAVSPGGESVALFSADNEIQIWRNAIQQRIHLAKGEYEISVHSQNGNSLFQDSITVSDKFEKVIVIGDNGSPTPPSITTKPQPMATSQTGGVSNTNGMKATAPKLLPKPISNTSGNSPTGGQR